MTPAARQRFDLILEEVLSALPPALARLIEESPLIVEDCPGPRLLAELGLDPDDGDTICGLHSGTPLTERSVADPDTMPETIHIFREGIVEQAGGWEVEQAVRSEIRITVLHEIGHHFGLDEDDLARLGYE